MKLRHSEPQQDQSGRERSKQRAQRQQQHILAHMSVVKRHGNIRLDAFGHVSGVAVLDVGARDLGTCPRSASPFRQVPTHPHGLTLIPGAPTSGMRPRADCKLQVMNARLRRLGIMLAARACQ